MKIRFTAVAALSGFLGTGFAVGPRQLQAQAPPGPLPSPQSQGIPVPPPSARPKRKEAAPRTTLAGAWKLNRDESDDPSRKIRDTKTPNPNARNYPGGGPGVGFPFPGAGGPMGGPNGGGMPRGQGNVQEDPKLLQVVQPAGSLAIELKTAEVDVTENQSHKLIFYTDGRQLQKPKDDSYQEIAAHWDGTRLVSDEKSPEKGKLSRTFELSQDGRQFYETLHVDTNKSKTPITIQYVYDMSTPEDQLSHSTDPNQPVMKRRSDDSSSQSSGAQSSQPADPDQPTMKRRSDDSTNPDPQSSPSQSSTSQTRSTQSPQNQPDSTPDPDQPVMKRRTDNTSSPSQ